MSRTVTVRYRFEFSTSFDVDDEHPLITNDIDDILAHDELEAHGEGSLVDWEVDDPGPASHKASYD